MIVFLIFMLPLLAGMLDIFCWFFIGRSVLVQWNEPRVIVAMCSTFIALLTADGMQ